MLISFSLPAIVAGELSAVRSFSTSEVSQGDTLRVSVELAINSAISTPAINEDLSEGLNLSVVNDGGASLFKESTLEWVFMSLFNTRG
jgi:hypothetical protein